MSQCRGSAHIDKFRPSKFCSFLSVSLQHSNNLLHFRALPNPKHKSPTILTISTMDYIDDLDQAAMDALNELYDGFSSLDVAPEAELSSEMDALIRSTKKQNTKLLSKSLHKSSIMNYLFRLNSPITASLLSSAAILPSQPEIIQGESEDGPAQFCYPILLPPQPQSLAILDIPILHTNIRTYKPRAQSHLPLLRIPNSRPRHHHTP
jgi:hypothetical protein